MTTLETIPSCSLIIFDFCLIVPVILRAFEPDTQRRMSRDTPICLMSRRHAG
ncbi:hypothetical protein BJX64DRAFT_261399, partial [Aspergillus heterothallicus]